MSRVLPILFNTEMVRTILAGNKTVTRKLIKPQPTYNPNSGISWKGISYGTDLPPTIKGAAYNFRCAAPYKTGDILYVRETYCPDYFDANIAGYMEDGLRGNRNAYKSDYNKQVIGNDVPEPKWHPSIHMPKKAARIWLKVTDVRLERLQDITNDGAMHEGFDGVRCDHVSLGAHGCTDCMNTGWLEPPKLDFMMGWDSIIKKSDLDRYGWDANPWVWVINFERCDKPEN